MATVTWKFGTSGNWTDGAHWSTGAAPTSAEDAAIAVITKNPFVVTVDSSDAANSLTFSVNSGELLENAGSLAIDGALTINAGTIVLNTANSIGSVVVNAGLLSLGDKNALASAPVTLSGGELLGTANIAILNKTTMTAPAVIAAARGTEFDLDNTISFKVDGSSPLTIGASGQDGIVHIYHSDASNPEFGSVDVRAGTLVPDFNLLAYSSGVTIEAGAIVDARGLNIDIADLQGAGLVTNSLPYSATLTFLGKTNFSGNITGSFSIAAPQLDVTLSGLTRVTGGLTINYPFTNNGTFDLPTDKGIDGYFSSSQFDNKGFFAKTGGAGTSAVTVMFSNEGTIAVDHGAISFNATTFTTSGSIRARVSSTSTTLTLSAATHIDLSDDGKSDILFRNGSGVTYLWDMNDSTVTSGATTSIQVGNAWQIRGVGDFDGDGSADLFYVYNNTANASDPLNGASYISFQNGASAIYGHVVQQLSTNWQVAAVGDFNGDGLADVLYRYNNASNASDPLDGATYLDIMNGTSVTAASGFTSVQIADPHWQIAGVGDFDGDGNADLLWRYDNASNAADPLNGVVYEWTMNGTGVASQGLVSSQPGSDHWVIAGVGDFDGNGTSDILFRYNNTSNATDPLNGLTYIDFMNGTQVTSGAPTQWQVDNSWSVASIADFNGDGKTDILFQHAGDATTYIWDMNGAAVTAGNLTSMQSGPGWTVQNGVLDG